MSDTFFSQTTCDRCGGSLEGGRIMSMFNTDCICIACKEKERQNKQYKAANNADIAAIKAGNYNFAGIGYPAEVGREQCLINTNAEGFDIMCISNRRFMYNPKTGTLVFGKDKELKRSHAQEFGELGCKEPFDDFIRGWIGCGKVYPNGVIHFAPNIPKDCVELFDKAFDTLLMFEKNGARKTTVVRGFAAKWEQELRDITGSIAEKKGGT